MMPGQHDTGTAQLNARYWPSGKVECAFTPRQAWRLHATGDLTHDEYQAVLRAWR